MKLIPVLDLKGGSVVHARKGVRSAYAPVDTPLCRGSHPVDVCAGLMTLFPFRVVYIADLDAIEGKGDNAPEIHALEKAFPQTTFWVDCGLGNDKEAQKWLEENKGVLVLGSESLENMDAVQNIAKVAGRRWVLSLDFTGDDFLGPKTLLDDPSLWPGRVIVMSLSKIGADGGPDMKKIRTIFEKDQQKKFFAAGGVAGIADLEVLKKAGVTGVLLASALYDGRVTGLAVERFCGTRKPGR